MKQGYATPFQGNDIAVASVTNASSSTPLSALLLALTGKRWSGDTTGQDNWRRCFSSEYPEIKNAQIKLSCTADFTIERDGATFPIKADTIELLTCQNLANIFVVGTNVKVLIQF